MDKYKIYILILIIIGIIILSLCLTNSELLYLDNNLNNKYIDNPYDLFYDPNYTTLFYEPNIRYNLNKPDGYSGTWSLGGSQFYPYCKTYINYNNPKRVISGSKMTRYGGRYNLIP